MTNGKKSMSGLKATMDRIIVRYVKCFSKTHNVVVALLPKKHNNLFAKTHLMKNGTIIIIETYISCRGGEKGSKLNAPNVKK